MANAGYDMAAAAEERDYAARLHDLAWRRNLQVTSRVLASVMLASGQATLHRECKAADAAPLLPRTRTVEARARDAFAPHTQSQDGDVARVAQNRALLEATVHVRFCNR